MGNKKRTTENFPNMRDRSYVRRMIRDLDWALDAFEKMLEEMREHQLNGGDPNDFVPTTAGVTFESGPCSDLACNG